MKYVIFSRPDGPRLGAVTGNRIVDLAAAYARHLEGRGVFAADRVASALLPPDLVAVLEAAPLSTEAAIRAVEEADRNGSNVTIALNDAHLDAPIRPHKIFGVRRNYSLHAEEAAVQVGLALAPHSHLVHPASPRLARTRRPWTRRSSATLRAR